MRNESHSWISILSDEVEAWRRAEAWSRESVVQQFVDAWHASGLIGSWGVDFSSHPDSFQRQKNNADKVYRWLNDVEKDTNLLTHNFARVILATLPLEYRMRAASKMLASIGLSVQLIDGSGEDELHINDIFAAQIDLTHALQHTTAACQNPTPENVEMADMYLARAMHKTKFLHRVIGGLKARASKAKDTTKAVINKALHRKVTA